MKYYITQAGREFINEVGSGMRAGRRKTRAIKRRTTPLPGSRSGVIASKQHGGVPRVGTQLSQQGIEVSDTGAAKLRLLRSRKGSPWKNPEGTRHP